MNRLGRVGIAAALLALLLPGACDGDSSGTPGGGYGGPPATNCASRCEAKARSCGAPATVAKGDCAEICGANITDPQLTCIENESCEKLSQLYLNGLPVCGVGESGDVGDDTRGGDGGQLVEDCAARCLAKTVECGAPAGIGSQICDLVCEQGATEEQAQCIEGESCISLMGLLFGGEAVCGVDLEFK